MNGKKKKKQTKQRPSLLIQTVSSPNECRKVGSTAGRTWGTKQTKTHIHTAWQQKLIIIN